MEIQLVKVKDLKLLPEPIYYFFKRTWIYKTL